MSAESRFDEAYYKRFYYDPRTRVSDPRIVRGLSAYVFAFLDHVGQPVEQVLDMGCGIGLWKKEVERRYPGATYTGVEYSEYLCRRYGWRQGSVVDFRPRRRYDLILCQGVLQYLDDSQAEAAIANLGRLCRGALYLEALTRKDWEEIADRKLTDGDVHLRTGSWYRRRLNEHFRNCGGGIFLNPKSPAILFELEHP